MWAEVYCFILKSKVIPVFEKKFGSEIFKN